jgi:hypothetical protein
MGHWLPIRFFETQMGFAYGRRTQRSPEWHVHAGRQQLERPDLLTDFSANACEERQTF